jgi:putative membrane-bound dehydrogenase-like protein
MAALLMGLLSLVCGQLADVIAGGGQKTSPQSGKEQKLLAGVKAPPGFQVTLFAAPPDVAYPTCLAAAPGGAMFVGIDENASLDRKPGRGRVVRCLDTDGDGRADKFDVFTKVDSPRGLFHDGETLYVLHPPNLSAFRDRDGVAGPPEVLVKGIGFGIEHPRGADHTTNGIQMGIDGWLYIAVGDFGFKATGKDGKALQFHGGGVARVRPDGTELEIVTRGQRNIYDVAIDPLLNTFTRDNTNDGGGWDVRLSHIIAGGHYGYPSLFKNFANEIVQPLADYGGGAPTGSLFVAEPGLPKDFGNTLYTCDWGRNAVYRHPLEASGAGFKAKQQVFVSLPRPTDIEVDGQGQLYISSWRGGEYHYRGPDVGYVVRVIPSGHKPSVFPDLKKANSEELLRHLTSLSHVCRLQTQREMLRRGVQPGQAEKLEKLAQADGQLEVRVAALFTLKQLLGPRSVDALVRLAKTAELREFALRALADRKSETAAVPAKLFIDSLADPNPRIRLQAVVGLARLGKRDAAEAMLLQTADTDPLVTHAAISALVSLHAVPACLKALDGATPKLIPGAARVLQSLHEPAVVEGLIRKVETTQDPAVSHAALKALCRLYYREADWDGRWWGTRPDNTGPYFKRTSWSQTERIGQVLKEALATADAATMRVLLVEMGRNRIDVGDPGALLVKFAARDPAFRATAVDLLLNQPKLSADAIGLLESVAASTGESAALRARALRRLSQIAKQPAAFEATVRVLAGLNPEKASQELVSIWEDFTRDVKQAQNVGYFVKLANADAGRRALAYTVLLHIGNNKNTPTAAKQTAARAIDQGWGKADTAAILLRAIGQTRSDQYAFQVRAHLKDARAGVREAATLAARALRLDEKSRDRVVLAGQSYEKVLAAALKEKGDTKLGAQLFLKQGCSACHTVAKNEPPKGPYLGDVAARYSRAELIESILKPSAKIAQGFETQLFTMADGKLHEGFVTREAGDEVEIRNLQGVVTVLPAREIEQRRRLDTSMMPVGLVDDLTLAELGALLAYVESLKTK